MLNCMPIGIGRVWLEKKSISITRLKQPIGGSSSSSFSSALKRKASRLRDWNDISAGSFCESQMLEKKSISITRLKPHTSEMRQAPDLTLKRKASRLRDWNDTADTLHYWKTDILKRKASRLRDWNSVGIPAPSREKSWKEKHLDYEIETRLGSSVKKDAEPLEKKSISITRLKLYNISNKRWKIAIRLEKKSISITRLKHTILPLVKMGFHRHLKRKASRLRDWNTRYLFPVALPGLSWKEKHLDYEIETIPVEPGLKSVYDPLEKKSISITRLKPKHWKWQHRWPLALEKKSISITRLKQQGPRQPCRLFASFNLKRKASRLRDWNSCQRGGGEWVK